MFDVLCRIKADFSQCSPDENRRQHLANAESSRWICQHMCFMHFNICEGCIVVSEIVLTGTWCSGITSALHAEGPGFNPQCVHARLLPSMFGPSACCIRAPRLWQPIWFGTVAAAEFPRIRSPCGWLAVNCCIRSVFQSAQQPA